LSNRLPI